ncbi:tyrosine-specific transport protein-like isoform X2 [Macadamia integrifolia]|uniref:tyrosine-specific transport protein-like isoform X2 n=1 Tax=Macadamia integrifolia TaxID=60698 RepID=UPI001C4FED3B|nr:tyrosine-specific transport protein-like isoform X2 [Macadamia integrifolia]
MCIEIFSDSSSYCGRTNHSGKHLERSWSAGNWKFLRAKGIRSSAQLRPEPIKGPETKGTVVGAVALIIGTSIGSGLLVLPKKTSSAGFIPSAVCMILCWGFLLIEALLLVEVNVGLLRKKRKKLKEEEELEGISIRTMAQETLGEWGGVLVTANYVFLGYTTMVAYTCKSAEILSQLINLPPSVSGIFFTTFFTILVSIGGTRTTDQVNQWLTVSMLGLLLAIEVQSLLSGGWSGLEMAGNWGKAPSTIPVIIFSLVYHDISPVICMYLGGDLRRIRVSVILGSVVPLLALLVWNAVVLRLPTQADDAVLDPVDLLTRVSWTGVSVMVEAFSLLAVGTSLIGTLLSFSQFFMEQLCKLPWHNPSNQTQKSNGNLEQSILRDESMFFGLQKWWHANKLRFMATAVAVAPPLFVSVTIPDAFSAATDIAGGYCMTTLYGVIPPAMAWAMHTNSCDANDHDGSNKVENNDQKVLSKAKPAVLGVGLFACVIVIEQALQDLLLWNP